MAYLKRFKQLPCYSIEMNANRCMLIEQFVRLNKLSAIIGFSLPNSEETLVLIQES